MKKLSSISIWCWCLIPSLHYYPVCVRMVFWYLVLFPCPRLRSVPNLPRASCAEVAGLAKIPIHPLGTLLPLAGHITRIWLLAASWCIRDTRKAVRRLRTTAFAPGVEANARARARRWKSWMYHVSWRSLPAVTRLADTRLPWLLSWARLRNLLMGDWFFSWYS